MLNPAQSLDQRVAAGAKFPSLPALHQLETELDRLSIADRAAKRRQYYLAMALRAGLPRPELSFGRMQRPRPLLKFDAASNFAPRQGRWGR